MWTKGQPWRVVGGLQKLNEQIRGYAPRSLPPATDVDAWGSIADDAHSSSSDHYPHFYSALGTTAVVCARDFPHAPALGLDGHVVTEALRVSRDPRIGYLICDRRITGPNHGWQWQHYDGSDPHDTHFHVSSVHTAVADDMRAWTLPGGTTVAEFTQQQINDVTWQLTGAPGGPLHVRVKALSDKLDQLLARQAIDVNALATAIAAALPPGTVDEAAILGVLQSPEGQAALVKAANTAEDS